MELPDTSLFPRVVNVRRLFPELSVDNIAAVVHGEMASCGIENKIEAGMKIAVTAGSRGIDRIGEVLRAVGEVVRSRGAEPFIVPAMGSHGGATARGQEEMLEGLGISEITTGMPLKSSMETVKIGTVEDTPVFMDKNAFSSDGIIVVNRAKPHTSIIGKYGSGLRKMMVVGLGKRDGAASFHGLGPAELKKLLPRMARIIMEKAPILGGVGLVEDSNDKLSIIKAAMPDAIPKLDSELLDESAKLMPRLPFDAIDVLVVREMGKDISGTGMDVNITGRFGVRLSPDLPSPRVKRIVILGLSAGSRGSAHGMGMADITTERMVEQIDWAATRENSMASSFPERARLPLAFPSDRDAVEAALATSWIPDISKARLVVIKNTLAMGKLIVSESLIEEIEEKEDAEIMGEPTSLSFDDEGWLTTGDFLD